MIATSFDAMARRLTSLPTRRDILRDLAGTGLGLGIARWSSTAEARKKRKKRNKKAKPNAFGCVNVGKFCKNDGQCCSGICEGKKGTRKCKAHGTGTCEQQGPEFCTAPELDLVLCNSAVCACIRTTAGSNFCFDIGAEAGSDCADCSTDADCEVLGFPPGSACAPYFNGEFCAGSCASGMKCVTPCGTEPSAPQ
jgi:hypothetical protein